MFNLLHEGTYTKTTYKYKIWKKERNYYFIFFAFLLNCAVEQWTEEKKFFSDALNALARVHNDSCQSPSDLVLR